MNDVIAKVQKTAEYIMLIRYVKQFFKKMFPEADIHLSQELLIYTLFLCPGQKRCSIASNYGIGHVQRARSLKRLKLVDRERIRVVGFPDIELVHY